MSSNFDLPLEENLEQCTRDIVEALKRCRVRGAAPAEAIGVCAGLFARAAIDTGLTDEQIRIVFDGILVIARAKTKLRKEQS